MGVLREQVRDLSHKLARAEREVTRADTDTDTRRARVMRQDAVGSRLDLAQTQFLIKRLHRRYPGGGGR